MSAQIISENISVPAPESKNTETTPSKREHLIRLGGWVFGIILALLLIAMMFGRQLQGVLNSLGLGFLYHEESGVYADCSRPENRSNPYCTSRKRGDQGWRNLKDSKGSPNGFSLY